MAQRCSAYGHKVVADGLESRAGESGMGPCPPCIELSSLERISAGETKLHDPRLAEQRLVKTRINQHHDPFVHRLPAELACRVLGFCCEPTPTHEEFGALESTWERVVEPVQLQLGAVCQYWRQIVWSNPNFWNSLWIAVHQKIPITRIFLMQEWLERSAQLPLFICVQSTRASLLKTQHPHERFPDPLIDALAQLLNSHLHRCSALHLDIPPRLVSRLRCSKPSFPLESLALSPLVGRDYPSPTERQLDEFAVGLLPCPTYVWISSYSIANVKIDWKNLTHFYGEQLTSVECLVVMQESPHLVKCVIEEVVSVARDVLVQSRHVLHNHLQHLELYDCYSEFLNYLTLPALETLELSYVGSGRLSGQPCVFIQRSQCSLKKLTIGGFDQTDASVIDFLLLIPSLSYLNLGFSLTKTFFDHLRETADALQGEPNTFLPNLRAFTYASDRMWFPWATMYSWIPTGIPSPHATRRPLSEVEFQLNLDPADVYGTTQEAIEETMISLEELYDLMDFMEKGVLKLRVTSLTEGIDLIEAWKRHHGLGGEDLSGVSTEILRQG